jgi:hypothetical protein
VRGEINDRDRDRDRHDKGWRGHDRGPSQLVVDRVFLEMVVQQQAAAQRGVAETGDHKQEVGVGAPHPLSIGLADHCLDQHRGVPGHFAPAGQPAPHQSGITMNRMGQRRLPARSE